MDRATFEEMLRAAAQRAVEFARRYVREGLPDEVTFLVYPNQSYDENPLVGDEVVFPGDEQPGGGHLGPWPAGQRADFLWRGGKVPEWIDIAVEEVVGPRTMVSLRFCGRFMAQDDLLYHRVWGLSHFLVKCPWLMTI